jgi:hypothetical protein
MIKLTDADVDEPMNLGLAEADNVILGALGSVLDCGLEMGYINVETCYEMMINHEILGKPFCEQNQKCFDSFRLQNIDVS